MRTTTRSRNELKAIPASAASAPTSARPCSARRCRGQLRRELDQHRPGRRLRPAREEIDAVAAKYPGLFRDVQTYLDERIEEVLTGGKSPSSSASTATTCSMLRDKSEEILGARWSRSTGSTNAHTDISQDVPQIEVTVDLDAGRAVRPQARRRPPGRGDAGGRRGGRRHLPSRARRTTSSSGAPRRPAVTSPASSELPIDTPSGAKVRLADVATVEVCAQPERDRPCRATRAGSTWAPSSRAATSGRSSTSSTQARGRELPARLPRRGPRRVQRAPGGAEPAAHVRDHRAAS